MFVGCRPTDNSNDKMCVVAQAAVMYKEPDFGSAAVAQLPRATLLFDGQLVSAHVVRAAAGAAMPFVYVSTTDKKAMGWVHGSDLAGLSRAQTKLLEALWVSRSWLGNDLTSLLQLYRSGYTGHPAHPSVVVLGDSLSTLVSGLINQAAQTRHAEASESDFKVFGELMPGFLPQIYDGRLYIWRRWQMLKEQAQTQNEPATARWCDVNMAFWGDSTSFAYPQWVLEDQGRLYNRLGDGMQLKWLQDVTAVQAELQPFAGSLGSLQRLLYDELIDAQTVFWYDQPKLLAEYEAILAFLEKHPTMVTKSVLVALEVRLAHFRSPDEYGVQYNQRAAGTE